MTPPETVPEPAHQHVPLMLRSVYLKTLRDQRHGLVGWSIGIVLLVVTESLIWPSFSDMPDVEQLFAQYPEAMKRSSTSRR